MDKIKAYKRLTKNLAQLISLAKIYNFEHPMVKEKAGSVYKEISDFLANNKESIVLAKSADMLLINGEKIEPDDKLMARFVGDFVSLDIGSIEFEPGLSREELDIFTHIMCHTEHITGSEKIKNILFEKKASHLIARAATFKLVQENEDIVKKGGFVKVEELPPEALKRFSKDFMDGKVSENLKTADKGYKMAAHNSTFLAGLTFNILKEKDTPKDLEKILWLLADYLIDEVGTAKEEDMNQEVLNDIKEKLISMWRDKPGKKDMVSNLEKTHAVINTALQIKGLLALYKKHKKELESSAGKIKEIMKNLPVNSQLYQKTMKDLAGMGPVSINESTFK